MKAEFLLGLEAVEFAKSEIGRYMIGRARQDRNEAMEKLKDTLPWRYRKIQQLQNTIWRAERFEEYLSELIINGKNAERILDDNDES